MACEFVCDGCGERQAGTADRNGTWHKPPAWFQRTDDDGTQVACSRACVQAVAERTGKTSVVLPI